MEPIYLNLITDLLYSKQLTMEDFNKFIEGLYKADKTVCIYETLFSKTPVICCMNYKDFNTWWDAMETKKKGLLEKIAASKLTIDN